MLHARLVRSRRILRFQTRVLRRQQQLSPFRLMHTFFFGLEFSVLYGIVGSLLLFFLVGKPEAQAFIVAYTLSFKTLVSLGFIVGTALIVFRSQDVIPETIECAFAGIPLSNEYHKYRKRFYSRFRSISFSANFTVVAFIIFSSCEFPLKPGGEALMTIAACMQYALGVYVGRKLFYAGMMLHSMLTAKVTHNLFRTRELDDINTYVHVASTLTVIFVYVHIIGYYRGPFEYHSILGQSIRPLLLLPAVIAVPVLLTFNFYPRVVLRRLYSQSIDFEIRDLRDKMKNEQLSDYEKRSYLLEVDKMSRDELRYSLQLTLSDLPIGITILVMLLQPVVEPLVSR